ncbi:uncharacterized protein LOC134538893 isoform X2 [Bacillus rossius redtenbacheri]|uniref:uncharacterized protein LOC134538893 isoform X2 n=1 Tax=Bacillus rossius redtenbacheri TaxID=93214 RepID=UPI002FDDC571
MSVRAQDAARLHRAHVLAGSRDRGGGQGRRAAAGRQHGPPEGAAQVPLRAVPGGVPQPGPHAVPPGALSPGPVPVRAVRPPVPLQEGAQPAQEEGPQGSQVLLLRRVLSGVQAAHLAAEAQSEQTRERARLLPVRSVQPTLHQENTPHQPQDTDAQDGPEVPLPGLWPQVHQLQQLEHSPENTFGKKEVQMFLLQEAVPAERETEVSHTNTHRGEASRLSDVRQELHTQVATARPRAAPPGQEAPQLRGLQQDLRRSLGPQAAHQEEALSTDRARGHGGRLPAVRGRGGTARGDHCDHCHLRGVRRREAGRCSVHDAEHGARCVRGVGAQAVARGAAGGGDTGRPHHRGQLQVHSVPGGHAAPRQRHPAADRPAAAEPAHLRAGLRLRPGPPHHHLLAAPSCCTSPPSPISSTMNNQSCCTFPPSPISSTMNNQSCCTSPPSPISSTMNNQSCFTFPPSPISSTMNNQSCCTSPPSPISSTMNNQSCCRSPPSPISSTMNNQSCFTFPPSPISSTMDNQSCFTFPPSPISSTMNNQSCCRSPPSPISSTMNNQSCCRSPPSPISSTMNNQSFFTFPPSPISSTMNNQSCCRSPPSPISSTMNNQSCFTFPPSPISSTMNNQSCCRSPPSPISSTMNNQSCCRSPPSPISSTMNNQSCCRSPPSPISSTMNNQSCCRSPPSPISSTMNNQSCCTSPPSPISSTMNNQSCFTSPPSPIFRVL